jgi:hypothetical protein
MTTKITTHTSKEPSEPPDSYQCHRHHICPPCIPNCRHIGVVDKVRRRLHRRCGLTHRALHNLIEIDSKHLMRQTVLCWSVGYLLQAQQDGFESFSSVILYKPNVKQPQPQSQSQSQPQSQSTWLESRCNKWLIDCTTESTYQITTLEFGLCRVQQCKSITQSKWWDIGLFRELVLRKDRLIQSPIHHHHRTTRIVLTQPNHHCLITD